MATQQYPEFEHMRAKNPILFDGLRKITVQINSIQGVVDQINALTSAVQNLESQVAALQGKT